MKRKGFGFWVALMIWCLLSVGCAGGQEVQAHSVAKGIIMDTYGSAVVYGDVDEGAAEKLLQVARDREAKLVYGDVDESAAEKLLQVARDREAKLVYGEVDESSAEKLLQIAREREEDLLYGKDDEDAAEGLLQVASKREEGLGNINGVTAGEMKEILDICEASGGALDITVGKLAKLWDINARAKEEKEDSKGERYSGVAQGDKNARAKEEDFNSLPTAAEIEAALKTVDYKRIHVDEAGGVITADGDISIDFGAVGKGLALDDIKECAVRGQTGRIVTLGGSVLVQGSKPGGAPWQIGVRDPDDSDGGTIGTISLDPGTCADGLCISTSGDYERFVMIDGVEYHHILDPRTGYPARSGLRSVTIICASGLASDALSTACFVLGQDEGMKLARSYGAEAVFITYDRKVTMTEALEPLWTYTH